MRIGHDDNGTPIEIPDTDRDKHMYVAGQTGTGKSTLLENMIAQDLAAGHCVVLIDPHGTTSEKVVQHIPFGRDDDLVYVQPSHLPSPLAINLLDKVQKDDRATRAGDIVAAFVDFFGERAIADRSEQILRNSLLALMETDGSTLLSVMPLLADTKFRDDVVVKVTDPLVRFYWEKVFEAYSDHDRAMVVSPILNKLDALFAYPAIRHTLAQPHSSVNLNEVIERKQILLVNLSGLADGADSIFGSLTVSMLWSTMRARGGTTPVYLYIDEFQRTATRAIPPILSEARKYRLSLTLAHQFWGQIDEDIKEAVFGNVGTLISLRMGATDAPVIARHFDKSDRQILDLANYSAYVRPIPPAGSVKFKTDPPFPPIRKSAGPLIANSLHTFGRDREIVEKGIRALFGS